MRDYYLDERNYEIDELEKTVINDKTSILKSASFVGVSALVFGIGTYGIITLGGAMIDRIAAGESLKLSTYLGYDLQYSGLGLSIAGTVAGAIAGVKNIRNVSYKTKKLKKDKERLNEANRYYNAVDKEFKEREKSL